jgi:hypothetical protein
MLTGIHFFATSCLGLGEAETPIIADEMIIKDSQNFIAAFICEALLQKDASYL